MKSDRLGQRVYFGLAGLFLLFIAYVSWSPVPEDAYLPNRGFFRGIERLTSLFLPHHFRDFASNILLYIPLGVFVASAVSHGRPRFFGLWTLVGFAVSVIMETGQSFFGRYPDALDIITNSVGYMIGYWVVLAAVRFYALDPVSFIGFDSDDKRNPRTQTIAVARFVYICVYVLLAMLPFDVSVIYYKIYAQLFPDASGHVRLLFDPFYHISHWHQSGFGLVWEMLLLFPVAALSALLNFTKGRLDVMTAVFPCVMVSLFTEATQVFVMSRTSDIAMFAVAITAGVLGWMAVKASHALRGIRTRATSGHKRSLRWRSKIIVLIAYTLVIVVISLWPFDFEIDHRTVAEKIFKQRNMLPFRYNTDVLDGLATAGAFLPLGFLLTYLSIEFAPRIPAKKLTVWSGLTCAVTAMFIAFLRTICVGRYFDATVVVLALIGGAVGAALMVAIRPRSTVGASK